MSRELAPCASNVKLSVSPSKSSPSFTTASCALGTREPQVSEDEPPCTLRK
jgi:hypothetical protein